MNLSFKYCPSVSKDIFTVLRSSHKALYSIHSTGGDTPTKHKVTQFITQTHHWSYSTRFHAHIYHSQTLDHPITRSSMQQMLAQKSCSIGVSGSQPRWSSHRILHTRSSISSLSVGVLNGFHLYFTVYPLIRCPRPHMVYLRVYTDMSKEYYQGSNVMSYHAQINSQGMYTHCITYRFSTLPH